VLDSCFLLYAERYGIYKPVECKKNELIGTADTEGGVLVKFVTGSKSKVKTAHKEKLSTSRYFLWCILVLESFMDVEEVRYDALPTSTKKSFILDVRLKKISDFSAHSFLTSTHHYPLAVIFFLSLNFKVAKIAPITELTFTFAKFSDD
jgi:hypothetical protein